MELGSKSGAEIPRFQKRKISKNAIFEGPKKVGFRGLRKSILNAFCRPKKAEQNAHSFGTNKGRESTF